MIDEEVRGWRSLPAEEEEEGKEEVGGGGAGTTAYQAWSIGVMGSGEGGGV